jgi:PAS domain S-box-containing protein
MSRIGIDKENIDRQNQALEAIFSTTDCGMMRQSVDGDRLISINNAALKILGYDTREELIAAGFDLIASSVAEEDKDRLRQCIQCLKKPGDSTSVNYRVMHKNGRIVDVVGRIKLLEKDGELIYQRFLLDVTAQKSRERKKRRMEQQRNMDIVQALSVDYSSVYYLNLDTETAQPYRLSDYMATHFGASLKGKINLKESTDMYRLQAVYKEDRDGFEKAASGENLLNELSKKNTYYFYYRVLRNNKIEHFQMKAVRVGEWDKEHNCVLGFRSVDEHTKKEIKQKKALSDALAQTEHASRAMTIFLNNMSEDIKNPVNAISGFAKFAMANIDDKKLVMDYLDKILTYSNRLQSFIGDVLDISRMEGKKAMLDEAEYKLDDIVDEICTSIQPDADDKEQHFTVEMENVTDSQIICDKPRLIQMISNCLGNAVKFTPEKGNIEFKVIQKKGAPVGFALYDFIIKDNGIGMSSEFTRHIFEPFETAESSDDGKNKGVGLGMAITKNIVDMMKGKISVESKEGEGSVFTITLRFRIACHHNIPVEKHDNDDIESKGQMSMRGRSILLVEDMEFHRVIAEIVLNEGGFKVDSVCNGKEAVDRITEVDENEYDMILMDVQMPVMDGYEACRQIRQLDNPVKASIPILAITENAFDDEKRNSMDAGMDGHLTKPIQINELYAAIRKHTK